MIKLPWRGRGRRVLWVRQLPLCLFIGVLVTSVSDEIFRLRSHCARRSTIQVAFGARAHAGRMNGRGNLIFFLLFNRRIVLLRIIAVLFP